MRHEARIKALLVLGILAVVAAALVIPAILTADLGKAVTWQRQVSPGRLSAAHAFLENDCAACHTAVRGPDPAKCIACHAGNEPLLQRQPTAFHANIASCRECHTEHRGIDRWSTDMNHAALARIGLRQAWQPADGGDAQRQRLIDWIRRGGSGEGVPSMNPGITPREAVLNCGSCHSNQDRHNKLFGQDCARCHSTDKWTIPEFRHPSPRSTNCAQCHQAPPSHYMEHFQMVSMKVAGKEHAQVNQCFQCHQTTSWNDIKGVGWYKHH